MKKFVSRPVFGELQLTQILNLKTCCCNLKIRGHGVKLCVFSIIFIFKRIMKFKVKQSMLFVEQKYKL